MRPLKTGQGYEAICVVLWAPMLCASAQLLPPVIPPPPTSFAEEAQYLHLDGNHPALPIPVFLIILNTLLPSLLMAQFLVTSAKRISEPKYVYF